MASFRVKYVNVNGCSRMEEEGIATNIRQYEAAQANYIISIHFSSHESKLHHFHSLQFPQRNTDGQWWLLNVCNIVAASNTNLINLTTLRLLNYSPPL